MDILGSLWDLWHVGDAVTRATAIILLVMSMGSWSIIIGQVIKHWQAESKLEQHLQWFWQTQDQTEQAEQVVKHSVASMLIATNAEATKALHTKERKLRLAYFRTLRQMQWGISWLASVGAVAPFVGLLGTVWGIYHALLKISEQGEATLERIAAPVGEALIMTAAGLVVAIPAVLAYNIFVQRNQRIRQQLDALAADMLSREEEIYGA